jgi:hypothetical protein
MLAQGLEKEAFSIQLLKPLRSLCPALSPLGLDTLLIWTTAGAVAAFLRRSAATINGTDRPNAERAEMLSAEC